MGIAELGSISLGVETRTDSGTPESSGDLLHPAGSEYGIGGSPRRSRRWRPGRRSRRFFNHSLKNL